MRASSTTRRPACCGDFNFNPKIQKHRIIDLATCNFVTRHENVLLIGKTGVGKSHVAQALGCVRSRYPRDLASRSKRGLGGGTTAGLVDSR